MNIMQVLCIIAGISVIAVFCALAYHHIVKLKDRYIEYDIILICLTLVCITVHSIIHAYVFWLYIFNWETITNYFNIASIIVLGLLDFAAVCVTQGE